MNRKIIGVVAAIALATVGTLVLVGWAQSAEERALEGQRTVDVLVVKEAVPEGTAAEDLGGRVATEQVVAKVRASGSVTDIEELQGKVAAVDLVPGEQLLSARFADPEELAQQADVKVPDGLQEVTISLSPERAVGGNVRSGDTVGLVASFPSEGSSQGVATDGETADGGEAGTTFVNETSMILHKVLVTRVQAAPVAAPAQEEGEDVGPEPLPSSDLLITLAVDAPAVERIVFSQEFGSVWLTLEPGSASEDGTTIQRRGTVFESPLE